GHDRQANLGHLREVLKNFVIVGFVDGGWQQQQSVCAIFLRVLSPLLGGVPAGAVHSRDHNSTTVDGLNRDLDDLAALLICERLVFAERTVGADTAASLVHQEVDVLGELVPIDSEAGGSCSVVLERQ